MNQAFAFLFKLLQPKGDESTQCFTRKKKASGNPHIFHHLLVTIDSDCKMLRLFKG